MREPSDRLHVLVVDDSAVVRQSVQALLERDRRVRVTTASDPIIASDKMKKGRPHVVILDLEMPRMDGLTFLRQLMASDPLPVIVCSALGGHFAEAAILALEAGAVDVITKPALGVGQFLEDSAARLREAVEAAAGARLREPKLRVHKFPAGLRVTTEKVVAIGASTGGTEALKEILEALPPDAPGIVVVQHMPEGFTRAFAQRLNATCRLEVKEAEDGDRVIRGRVLIAHGNRHLRVRRSGAFYEASVSDGPLVNRHRPSVDVLFESMAAEVGANAVGVILTGMGSDGAAGLAAMKKAGASTIAQDEATCVVFGMPKEAIARGAVEDVVGLPHMAGRILRRSLGDRVVTALG